MTIEPRAERLSIEVFNSVRGGLLPNPGVGLELQATGDRLSIIHGEAAQCRTEVGDGWFKVRLSLPTQRPISGGQEA